MSGRTTNLDNRQQPPKHPAVFYLQHRPAKLKSMSRWKGSFQTKVKVLYFVFRNNQTINKYQTPKQKDQRKHQTQKEGGKSTTKKKTKNPKRQSQKNVNKTKNNVKKKQKILTKMSKQCQRPTIKRPSSCRCFRSSKTSTSQVLPAVCGVPKEKGAFELPLSSAVFFF